MTELKMQIFTQSSCHTLYFSMHVFTAGIFIIFITLTNLPPSLIVTMLLYAMPLLSVDYIIMSVQWAILKYYVVTIT